MPYSASVAPRATYWGGRDLSWQDPCIAYSQRHHSSFLPTRDQWRYITHPQWKLLMRREIRSSFWQETPRIMIRLTSPELRNQVLMHNSNELRIITIHIWIYTRRYLIFSMTILTMRSRYRTTQCLWGGIRRWNHKRCLTKSQQRTANHAKWYAFPKRLFPKWHPRSIVPVHWRLSRSTDPKWGPVHSTAVTEQRCQTPTSMWIIRKRFQRLQSKAKWGQDLD
jgi:hypothetical protein